MSDTRGRPVNNPSDLNSVAFGFPLHSALFMRVLPLAFMGRRLVVDNVGIKDFGDSYSVQWAKVQSYSRTTKKGWFPVIGWLTFEQTGEKPINVVYGYLRKKDQAEFLRRVESRLGPPSLP